MGALDDLIAGLAERPPEKVAAALADANRIIGERSFIPLPGPQTDAYLSKADVLLYGGSAGGGKSFLTLGLAIQEHHKSIIFRRETVELDGLISASKEIMDGRGSFNGSDKEWSWAGKSVKFGGMKEPDDWRKFAGRERDFMGFDEAGEFLEEQVVSIMAWLRAPHGRRCRVVFASNPPRGPEGAWVREWFAPWLEPGHPMAAESGELRWAVMVKGKTVWVDGPDPVTIGGEIYTPMSRTFIPAKLSDNPYRNTAEYRAKLQSLHEPLRSQLLYGDFGAGRQDADWQCIPSAWVYAAQERWTPAPPSGIPMCSMGVDVALGGDDETVIAMRHDGWFAPLIAVPGSSTPTGADQAGLVVRYRRDNALVVIDVGGGFGAEAYGQLKANSIEALAYMGISDSRNRTKSGLLKFKNQRTEAYWRFREALDPGQPGGSQIMLPDDAKLVADLTAPQFRDIPGGIELQSKQEVIKALGRSPDRGDAVVMAWFAGAKLFTHGSIWQASRRPQYVSNQRGRR